MNKLICNNPKSYLFYYILILSGWFFWHCLFPDYLQSKEINFLENSKYQLVPQMEQLSSKFPDRSIIDLNGEWEYRVENDPTWRPVKVPSCYTYQGRVYYRKKFQLDNNLKNNQLRLYAYGINYLCLMMINGRIIGTHTGGYSSFLIDIPYRTLNFGGSNTIEIEVDNRLNVWSTIPLEQQIWGWLNYGGIFREIYIIGYPRVSIDDAYVQYNFDSGYKTCHITIKVELRNNTQIARETGLSNIGVPLESIPTVACRAELYDLELGKIVALSPSPDMSIKVERLNSGQLKLTLLSPVLWDFTNPKRYRLRVTVLESGKEIDAWSVLTGFRDFRIEKGSMFLNGEPLRLFGLAYFEDLPGYGSAVNWQSLEEDIIQMKDLGINLILGGMYPCHPYLYSLCDRYGLFIIESLPLWQIPRKRLERPEFSERSLIYLQEMILRDRNHPSILAWGLGMEMESIDEGARQFLTNLHRRAKELDTRPTMYTTSFLKRETAGEITDITGLSFRRNISLDEFSKRLTTALEQYRDRPVIVGRYGCELVPTEEKGSVDHHYSVEKQAKFIEDWYQQIQHFSELDGHIFWNYADWRGQRPLLNLPFDADPYLYSTGLLDYQHHERISYHMTKALLSGDEHPTLNIPSQKKQETFLYQIVGLVLLSFLVYTSKRSIRFGDNIKRSIVYRQSFFLDIGTRQILPFMHTLFLSLIISTIIATIFSALIFYFRRNVFFDFFLSQILFWNPVKEVFTRLAWSPSEGILYGTAFFFLFGLLFTFFVSISKLASRRRISWDHAYHIVVWAGSPIILLIPLAMTLYPGLDYQGVLPFTFIVFFIFFFWIISRTVGGLSIVYSCTKRRIYLTFGTIGTLLFIILCYWYQSTRGALDYFHFYLSLLLQ